MTDTSARLALPMLQPGQAQKEIVHNEALALLDLAVQAGVVSAGSDVPPAAPEPGQCWIVGSAPTGGWAGHADALAGWTAGGWRLVAPREGFAVWDGAHGHVVRWSGGRWIAGEIAGARVVIAGRQVVGERGAAIAAPAGGMVVDQEARAALERVLSALRSHGLIER